MAHVVRALASLLCVDYSDLPPPDESLVHFTLGLCGILIAVELDEPETTRLAAKERETHATRHTQVLIGARDPCAPLSFTTGSESDSTW